MAKLVQADSTDVFYWKWERVPPFGSHGVGLVEERKSARLFLQQRLAFNRCGQRYWRGRNVASVIGWHARPKDGLVAISSSGKLTEYFKCCSSQRESRK